MLLLSLISDHDVDGTYSNIFLTHRLQMLIKRLYFGILKLIKTFFLSTVFQKVDKEEFTCLKVFHVSKAVHYMKASEQAIRVHK